MTSEKISYHSINTWTTALWLYKAVMSKEFQSSEILLKTQRLI